MAPNRPMPMFSVVSASMGTSPPSNSTQSPVPVAHGTMRLQVGVPAVVDRHRGGVGDVAVEAYRRARRTPLKVPPGHARGSPMPERAVSQVAHPDPRLGSPAAGACRWPPWGCRWWSGLRETTQLLLPRRPCSFSDPARKVLHGSPGGDQVARVGEPARHHGPVIVRRSEPPTRAVVPLSYRHVGNPRENRRTRHGPGAQRKMSPNDAGARRQLRLGDPGSVCQVEGDPKAASAMVLELKMSTPERYDRLCR